jgi:hypothetical protein
MAGTFNGEDAADPQPIRAYPKARLGRSRGVRGGEARAQQR